MSSPIRTASTTIEGTPSSGPAMVEREFTTPSRSRGRQAVRRYFRSKIAAGALILYVIIIPASFIVPIFYRWDWNTPDPKSLSVHPLSHGHPLGTDGTGFDLLAQIMRGTQRSFVISIVSVGIAMVIGIAVGALAGYFGGILDNFLMRIIDLLLTVPILVVLIVVASRAPDFAGKAWGLAVFLGILGWMGLGRLVRGQFLSLREREFVEAAHAMGAKDSRIIFKHLIPNCLGTILVFATLFAAQSIIAETALTYLGRGIQPPDTSLGRLISDGVDAADTRPWLFYFPGIMVVIIVLATNLIGDGIRNAFDPKNNQVRD